MAQRVNLFLDDDFAETIKAKKPRSLSLSAFCALLIEQGLTGGAKLPAYCVGAGTSSNSSTEAQPPNEAFSSPLQASGSVLTSIPPDGSLGDGIGREYEGTPRKPPCKRIVSDNLQPFSQLIEDFWRIKGGSKGDRAWSLLQTELTKLQKQYGDAVVRQQIELAINGKWKGITEANYTRFLPKGPGGVPAQPETRHPASRVFTAAKGFDDEPVINPILREFC
jgi:hypothetical protein